MQTDGCQFLIVENASDLSITCTDLELNIEQESETQLLLG